MKNVQRADVERFLLRKGFVLQPGGKTYRGTVDSLAAGTGARFSLLPPENATGNWVKVVQRLPVKIRLDAKEVGNPAALRAGMSAYVTIKIK